MTGIQAKVEEGQEREGLKNWNWEHDTETIELKLDAAAIHGADTMLNEIKDNASAYVSTGDNGEANITVNLFGDYFLVFDLFDLIDDGFDPSIWENESVSAALSKLRELADKIERRIKQSASHK